MMQCPNTSCENYSVYDKDDGIENCPTCHTPLKTYDDDDDDFDIDFDSYDGDDEEYQEET